MGRVTTYTYDSSYDLLTVTDPNGGKILNTYNSESQVLTQKDPKGLTTTYNYGYEFNHGPYEPGYGTEIIDPHGSVTIEITAAGLDSVNLVGYGTPTVSTTQYTYDGNDDLISVTDPNGHTTAYTYDSDGNLTSRTDAVETCRKTPSTRSTSQPMVLMLLEWSPQTPTTQTEISRPRVSRVPHRHRHGPPVRFRVQR